ncbi:hypothetical protein Nmel_006996 [Mimus melanotis]
MLALLVKHGKSLPKLDLKLILKWVAVKRPDATASSIFTAAVGMMSLAPCPTLTLPTCLKLAHLILESSCSHQPPPLPSQGGEGILSRMRRGLFDPGPVDPDAESDLFPPKPHENWVQIKKKALKKGDFDIAGKIVMPVMFCGARGNNLWWEPLTYLEIKELHCTATEHGSAFLYFANLLQSMLSIRLMTPHDSKEPENLLLTQTQYAIFDAQWKKGLEALLVKFVVHANQNIAALMMDHLAGEGAHSYPAGQAHIPKEALKGITEPGRTTFLKVPNAAPPQKVFTNTIENDIAREVLLLKLTVKNTNEDCKKLLKSLPKKEPTLLEMVEACNCLRMLQHIATISPGDSQRCFGCRKPGHLKRNCFRKGETRSKAPSICPQCHKGRHYVNQCHSETSDIGKPHVDTNASTNASEQTTARLSPATTSSLCQTTTNLQPTPPGSASLDLETFNTVMLLDSSVHLLPKGKQEFLDHQGSTLIMAWTLLPPCTVPKGTRIAQLIFVPQTMSVPFTGVT